MSEPTTPIPPETPAVVRRPAASRFVPRGDTPPPEADRKSTRLNSSHW